MFERTRSFFHRLAAGRSETSADERRLWDRLPSQRETTIRTNADGDDPLTARIADVSHGGVRLIVTRPLDEGEMIQVELPPRDGEPVTTILACVVHVRTDAPGMWSLGCSFATELNDADMESLGTRRVKPEDGDKRNWQRVPLHGHAILTMARTPHEEPQTAPILNISPTGVALRVNRSCEAGALMQLELHAETGQTVLTILGCVVYISEVGDGQWLMGCNFIRELDENELSKLT